MLTRAIWRLVLYKNYMDFFFLLVVPFMWQAQDSLSDVLETKLYISNFIEKIFGYPLL